MANRLSKANQLSTKFQPLILHTRKINALPTTHDATNKTYRARINEGRNAHRTQKAEPPIAGNAKAHDGSTFQYCKNPYS